MTTLEDIVRIVQKSKTDDGFNLMEGTSVEEVLEVSKYMEELDSIGTEILKNKNPVHLIMAVSLLQSKTIQIMLELEDITEEDLDFFMSKTFTTATAWIVKLTIALAAIEEIR